MKPSKLGCALSSPSTAGESQHLPQRQPGELVCVPLTMISAQSTRTGCRNHPGIWKHSVMVERGCVLSVFWGCVSLWRHPNNFACEAGGFMFVIETRRVLVFTACLMPHSLCLLFLQRGAPLFSSQILKDYLQSACQMKVNISTFPSHGALLPLCFKADHWKVHRWQPPDWGGGNAWFSESTLHLLIWSLIIEEICWDAEIFKRLICCFKGFFCKKINCKPLIKKTESYYF